MRKGQGSFEYILLMAGILFLAVVAFYLLRDVNQYGKNQGDRSYCFSKLAVTNVCYNSSGGWKADTVTKYKINDYGLAPSCTRDDGGALVGTPYDVNGSDDEFYCGPLPPA